MAARSRLDARLLIGRGHELVISQRTSLPLPVVEIEEPSCLMRKVGVARKDPAAMLPRADGILVQPTPDRALTERGDPSAAMRLARELSHAPARQRALADAR